MELEEMIVETVNKAVEKALFTIQQTDKKSSLNEENLQQRTIKVLKSYINLKHAIGEHEEDIEYIKKYGLPQRTSSIIRYSKNDGMRLERTEEDKIIEITNTMNTTKELIQRIEQALFAIKDEEYFEIIPMTYFQKLTREEIAEYFNVEPKTITRNRNKLIDEMSVILFSEEYTASILTK